MNALNADNNKPARDRVLEAVRIHCEVKYLNSLSSMICQESLH